MELQWSLVLEMWRNICEFESLYFLHGNLQLASLFVHHFFNGHHCNTSQILMSLTLCVYQMKTVRRIYNFGAADASKAQEWTEQIHACIQWWGHQILLSNSCEEFLTEELWGILSEEFFWGTLNEELLSAELWPKNSKRWILVRNYQWGTLKREILCEEL